MLASKDNLKRAPDTEWHHQRGFIATHTLYINWYQHVVIYSASSLLNITYGNKSNKVP